MPSAFADLATRFLEEQYAEHPVRASGMGLTEYDDQLDDLTATAFERRADAARAWRERFAALAADELSFDEAIDRDLAVAALDEQAIYDEWGNWRRHPDIYLNPGMRGVFILFLHMLRPEAELARSAANRLRQVPANLEAGRANLRPELVPPVLLDRAINQARAGANYTRHLLPMQVAEANRAELAEAGAAAADAFEAYAAFLEEMAPTAAGDWAFGEERYDAVLHRGELLSFDARALRETGRQQLEELTAALRETSRRIAGHEDWHALVLELNKDRPATPEDMRRGYEEWTEKARAFLRERRLVSFPPGEECHVVPSPPYQRPVLAVASYVAPPSYAETMAGHFFVPFPPDGASEEEIAKRLESNCYPGIPTTAVHEAYPGHHWHLVMAKGNPSHLRQWFGTSYFAEGWALYAERMMEEAGFYDDPRHILYRLEATLFRAARIVADTSLHLGEMSHAEAVQFMMANSAMTEPTATAEVTRYCSWPTQASSYLTGCLEILRIRDRYLAARGTDASDVDALRAFHDTIAAAGTLPIALAERAVMATVG
ncbi:MAG TPA: DUF885 domain-containing protein [candidate division Zixibacteria bacterium]|nr:DUF885 domain-containing protein [candidate division Zixibacteria bacterium]